MVQNTPHNAWKTLAVRLIGWVAAGSHGTRAICAVVTMAVAAAPTAHGQCVPSFAAPVGYSAGNGTQSVAIGDFNGDGRPDLVTANYSGSSVSVLMNSGGGMFGVSVNYSVDTHPNFVAVGDLNGDGRADLITANFIAAGTVSVLLGIGNGTFGAAVNYATGSYPASVAIGDLNSDGRPDLAVANYGRLAPPDFPGNISVLLGNGNGTFSAAVSYNAGNHPNSVAIGDLNGDGKPDLAVANTGNIPLSADSVSVLLGNGDGTFATRVNYDVGAAVAPYRLAVGDLNGDGHPDLAVANFYGGVSVLLGNGDGTYQPGVTYGAGDTPYSVIIGDLNGDGLPDLAVANANSNNVSVLLGNGDGTFGATDDFAAGATPYSVAIGDFNRNGLLDLAVANNGTNTVSVLLNTLTSITQQPHNQHVAPSQTATFMVTAPGASSFQWQHRGAAIANGGHFSGVVSSTLTITNTTTAEAGPYDVRIIGGCHSGEYSKPAMLCVMAPVCRGDFNNDGLFNTTDIPTIVNALLAGQLCP